ncbi:MAG: hypothetical protein FJ381_04365 [Verrucomicrobia bacterium]|nr:hypothetical protein [Verrucomicrobiota bacterium]
MPPNCWPASLCRARWCWPGSHDAQWVGGLLALALPAGFALEGRRETSLTNPRRSVRWLFVSPTFFLGMVYC